MSMYDDEEILDEEEQLNEEGPGPVPDDVLESAAEEEGPGPIPARVLASTVPTPPKAPAASEPPAGRPDSVAEFIAYKRLLGDDAKALEATRKAARARMREANQMQAIGDLAAGLVNVKVDPGYYNTAREQDQAEVKGAESDLDRNRRLVQEFIADKRAGQGADLRSRSLDETIRHNKAMEGVAGRKAASAAGKPSIGQQAVDREYGKQFAKRTAEGGYADAEKGLKQIDDAIKALGKTDSATGGIVGLIPKTARDVVLPEGAAIQDAVEEVVQRNLRKVLGPQFTEKEGDRLIARAYNPRLSEAENIQRLNRLKAQIQNAIQLQQTADDYFNEHGTLQGFKGRLFSSADDFDLDGKDDAGGKKKYKWAK